MYKTLFSLNSQFSILFSRLTHLVQAQSRSAIVRSNSGSTNHVIIATCYDLLGLMSFLTAGPKEVRAWTIQKGTKAPQAAGKIHTDFERGFIRAEVVSYDDLIANGTMQACKDKGLIRSEGKDYVMRDGDVVVFRFNV